MPLLGTKLHVLNPLWKKRKARDENGAQEPDKEPPFLVPETQEICSSSEELQRKKTIYAGKIWACRVTGKSNLTFRDASKSEAFSHRLLRKSFPNFFSKPLLELIHLSTQSLDNLVHLCWTHLQEQFHISEPVKLKVDSVSKNPIHGIIEHVDSTRITDVDTTVNSSSTTSPNSSDKENAVGKKNVPVKKNYIYTVKVVSEVPLVVNDIPASSIDRLTKGPSKEQIRMFIRAHAMRYGPNFSGPWIVDADMLRRYKIPSKNRAYEVDKVKLKQLSDALEIEYFSRLTKNERQQNGVDLAEESTTEKQPSNPATPFFKRGKHFSVLREGNTDTTPEDDLPLSVFRRKSNKKSIQSPTDELIKRKMKQATLFQFHKNTDKPNASAASSKSNEAKTPVSKRNSQPPSTPCLPRVAQQLVQLYTEKPENPMIATYINMCAKLLSDADVGRLPSELREKVSVRKQAIDYRKKLHSMTPVQRKAFLLEQRRKRSLDRRTANCLCDDQELINSSDKWMSLPQPSQLELPSFMTKELFGRLLGLSEFFHCFETLLIEGLEEHELDPQNELALPLSTFPLTPLDSAVPCPGDRAFSDDDDEIHTEEEEEEVALIEATAPLPKVSARCFRRLGLNRLIHAISSDSPTAGAYRSLARPICLLLRLLLRDENLAKKRELGIRLAKLPVTPYTAPELLRLALLAQNHSLSRTQALHQDCAEVHSHETPLNHKLDADQDSGSLPVQMSHQDIYELCPTNRLQLLETAVERLFDLDLIDDHILACHRRAQQALTKKLKAMKDRNMRRKEHKEEAPAKSEAQSSNATASGAKVETESQPGPPDEDLDGTDDDLASIVKRRRILAARAAAEREEKRRKREEEEALERERRAIQAQEIAEERALAQLVRAYEIRAAESRCALRCQPIGLDRYHRRIWYFRCAPDRLFVESNWASPYIDYCICETQETSPRAKPLPSVSEKPQAVDCETTLPPPAHLADNAVTGTSWSNWSVYDRPEQLDQLANALLERGVRESQLKRRLMASGLLDSIKARWSKFPVVARTSEPLSPTGVQNPAKDRTSEVGERIFDKRALNAEAALAGALLKNLLDTEVRLRSGGLGGVPDFAEWQAQLAQVHTSFGLPLDDSPLGKKKPERIVPATGKPNRSGLVSALLCVADHVIPRFLNVPNLLLTGPDKTAGKLRSGEDSAQIEPAEAALLHSSASDSDDQSENSSDSSSVADHVLLKDPDQHVTRAQLWLDTWRNEVRNSRTLARLNLLHACLDACIRWEKSVEDARCRICRHKSDDDNLLLCDGCNRAFHLYCLRPPLKRVPAGDWFCPSCRPATKDLERRLREERLARAERRRRRVHESSSDDEDDEAVDSDKSGTDDQDSPDGRRPSKRGSNQTSFKRSKSRHDGHTSRGFVEPSKPSFKNDTTCLVCDSASDDLIHCSHCPNVFHLACHNPPLRHLPRGDGWQCTSCRMSSSMRKMMGAGGRPLSKEKRRAQYQRCCVSTGMNHELLAMEDRPLSRTRTSQSSGSRRARLSSNRLARSSSEEPDSDEDHATETTPSAFTESHSRRLASTPRNARPAKRRRIESLDSDSPESESNDGDDSEEEAEEEEEEEEEEESTRHRATRIVTAITKHRNAWPFREPVDKKEVPDYYEIISNPIDLTTIRSRLANGQYDDPQKGLETLAHDLGTMFYNAELYNAADSDVWIAGSNLEQFVKNQFSQPGLNVTYHRPALGDL